jgi:hypothetical protein
VNLSPPADLTSAAGAPTDGGKTAGGAAAAPRASKGEGDALASRMAVRRTELASAGVFGPGLTDGPTPPMLVPAMKRFLMELEKRMATLSPEDRQALRDAFLSLARAIDASTTAFGKKFRPSKMALLGIFTELGSSMTGSVNLIAKAKKLAPTIGPHVTSIVQAL